MSDNQTKTITDDELLEGAVAKVNWLHLKGFGFGLSDEELKTFNESDKVVKTREGPWGDIYGIKNNGGMNEVW